MKKLLAITIMVWLMICSVSASQAGEPEIYDWGFNIDGTSYCIDACDFDSADNSDPLSLLPSFIDISEFDLAMDFGASVGTGIGTITITLCTDTLDPLCLEPVTPGEHTVVVFLNHDIFDLDPTPDHVYFVNETGAIFGTPELGQKWEIDDPDFGNIINHFFITERSDQTIAGSQLDNDVFDGFTDTESDVSMAMSWDFSLAAGEQAVITVVADLAAPPTPPYLTQTDMYDDTNIYLSSSIEFIGGQPQSEVDCLDGIDNDGDGQTDCADSDCNTDPNCVECLVDADCNDGLACNGPETCDANGSCQAGTALVCDDGNACNGIETCDDAVGCVEGTAPVCDDGNACNGIETCDDAVGCVDGTALVCDDGQFCNGVETCDATGGCQAGTPPCPEGQCNDSLDACVECRTDADCNDGLACNGTETCDASGSCQAGTALVCDDGNACNGIETCDDAVGCVDGPALVCDDGNACNGVETCDDAVGCVEGTSPVCDDGNACNGMETCDDAVGCVDGTAPVCDDGLFCNGVETCDAAAGCQPGTSPCPDGKCNDNLDACVQCDTDADCDDNLACNGTETCDTSGNCQAGTPLVCDDGNACNGMETCDDAVGCVDGTAPVCDDGLFCNGVETCDAAAGCQPGTSPCPDGKCDRHVPMASVTRIWMRVLIVEPMPTAMTILPVTARKPVIPAVIARPARS